MPGSTSEEATQKTLIRVNYFRSLVGLPPVEFDHSTDIYTQSAALMMKANNAAVHNPPPTWNCYSSAGAVGAGHSNLAPGAHSSGAITPYIEDPGLYNHARAQTLGYLF